MFYGVYYYTQTGSAASVYLVGFYDNMDTAKQILNSIIPNYKPNYHNSVSGNGRVGWINKYEMNQHVLDPNIIAEKQLACNQPHSSINLFNDLENDLSVDME